MSGISALQGGQSGLEWAACDAAVLLRPITTSTPVLTNLEKSDGSLDTSLINQAAGFVTVGNWTKQQGVSLSNNPTINQVKSHGKGSPTRLIASESEKGITYQAQENVKLINLQTAWGFPVSAVQVSTTGGVTIQIPALPLDLEYQAILLAWDYKLGGDCYRYWIANLAALGKRADQKMTDGDVDTLDTNLTFLENSALPGVPIVFGICGQGWTNTNAVYETGFLPAVTGITVIPTTAAMTVAAGSAHTKQLQVKDSNNIDQTANATYASSATGIATVSPSGLITAVAAGTANITASYGGFTATCAVTVS